MSELKKCAGPGCHQLEDPRWGGFCDGHGPTTDAERAALLEGWRAQNEKVAKLEATVSELTAELENKQKSFDIAAAHLVRIERERAARVVADHYVLNGGSDRERRMLVEVAEAIRRGE